jgi:anthranilate phosphoribosyltransferase
MNIKEAIDRIVNLIDLTEDEMVGVMEYIMNGEATPAQIAAFITALRIKGETVNEIVGAVKVMRNKAVKINSQRKNGDNGLTRDEVVMDIVGTGGDAMKTFNISTAAAFVVAAGGITVAKHGNRSISSNCGSADVLEALGINIAASPESVARHIEDVGIGFLFAPVFHASMKHAVGPRREIGIRTIFNILGPLTNPASATHLLLGVYKEEFCEVFARVLAKLGTERAMIVHGLDGMDEISVTTDTKVTEIRNGGIYSYDINPKYFGLQLYTVADLEGGDAGKNAEILKGILSGAKNGAKRAAVLINAGAAFYVSGISQGIREGVAYARDVIDSGAAIRKLEELVEACKS